jgi:glutathione S-transferase
LITVHHLNNSRSQRILWLLEELGLDYEVKHYQRDKTTMLAPGALRNMHPLGKSPVITDGDQTIAESGAIVEYIIETYGVGRMIPAPGPDRLRYRYWLHYAEGSAMPPLVMKLIFSSIPDSPQMPWYIKPIARGITNAVIKNYIGPQVQSHIAFWEAELAKSTWFAGDDLTGADIMMSFPIEAAGASLPERLTSYLAAIHARPAYQQALTRGGPYQLMR